MIYAIGHDIVENSRIAAIISRYGMQFIKRLLTADEIELYLLRDDKVKFVAKRFAAKEAFAKACCTGLRVPVTLLNISVLNNNLGKPYFKLSLDLDVWLKQQGINKCHLTISDERSISSAVVILER